MLSEAMFDELLKEFNNRMQGVTDEYIAMMGEHLRYIGKLKASDLHRLAELKRIGANTKEIQRKLAKAANMSVGDLEKVFRAVAESDEHFAKQWFKGTTAVAESAAAIERTLKAQLRVTALEFRNLSRTTVVAQAYRSAVDVAIQSVQSGVTDYNSAIRRAMKAAAKDGLRVEYASGVTRRLDTAARQNVLDGVRALNNDILRQLGNAYGANGVEISAHALCAEDHLPYQGRQYSNEDFERIQSTLARPIGQWNCKHTIYPIILGVSQPANDQESLAQYFTNSAETVEIDGRHKTRYEWSQEQRKIETAVRYQKDIANMASATGDDVARREAQANINALQDRWQYIAAVAGLESDKKRMTVSGFRAVRAARR